MTWDSFAEFYQNYLGNIFFTDPDHGWISYKTQGYDGVYLYPITYGVWNPMGYYYFPFMFKDPANLYFNDLNNGWVVCENVIMTTSNSGHTWESKNSITNIHFESVVFTDASNGWTLASRFNPCGAACWDNIIFHTNDGGSNWGSIVGGYTSYSINEHLQSLFFVDQNHGWASGSNFQGCFILKTSNGGLDWDRISLNIFPGNDWFYSLYFIDTSNGWAINDENIYITTDGGYTWNEQYIGLEDFHLNVLFFHNDTTGWAVGKDTADNSYIINTVDGGNSWQEQISGSFGEIYSVQFIDQNLGWAVGENTILHTTDGGDQWLVQEYNSTYPYSTYRSVCFIDEDRGWIAGNKAVGYSINSSVILFTDDGGNTWDIQFGREGGQFNSICAVDQNNVWAVGDCGTIIHTDNGGISRFNDFYKNEFTCMLFPNPTTNYTSINIDLPKRSTVILSLLNIFGQQIKYISLGEKKMGTHQFEVDCSDLSKGIYLVKLQAGKDMVTKKLVVN